MRAIEPITEDSASSSEVVEGVAIALSGGGYRAMLFHAGVLWRLGQWGFFSGHTLARSDSDGALQTVGSLERISSVSGGSITSAALALAWPQLRAVSAADFDEAYARTVIAPLRELAATHIAGTSKAGVLSMLKNIVLPGSVNDRVAKVYDRVLFRGKTLQDLPDDVRFVFNASNLQSGALWRFSKPFMRDWRVGMVERPKVSLAHAVGASSAFPPFLAPARLGVSATDFVPGSGDPAAGLQRPPFTSPVLADGGVYDNLGLETCYKRYRTLLVSNAGKPFASQAEISSNWVPIGARCLDLVDNQVLSLRKRLLLQALIEKRRYGAFWDIQQSIATHPCSDPLPCPPARTAELAQVATDLDAKPDELQERLINWGYAAADASVRAWFNRRLPAPGGFPYPARGV
ncbi:patatin-like phospholipase family protein [Pseudomonas sp. CGJS7]|uniref:patatin-like phospholipase family protein n=1 Tax=Pseudomonas sp. CGJS7 TaxID=3109348 RepID=UPI003009DE77